ncbi:hypothetical protein HDU77_003034 [Chytriomyces hyalinus]|nr:hypothetical protein HDU77_003034 [Chytriomyces hyalinus]
MTRNKRNKASSCFLCNYESWEKNELVQFWVASEWKEGTKSEQAVPTSEETKSILENMNKFTDLLDTFKMECHGCDGTNLTHELEGKPVPKPVVVFAGASGAGKSSIVNIVCGSEPSFSTDRVGRKILTFKKGIAKVSSKNESETVFPVVYKVKGRRQVEFVIDFPGFGENRHPALEMLQRIVMRKILTNRDTKVFLVKSIATVRDADFHDLLQSPLVNLTSCAIIFNRTSSLDNLDWKDVVDLDKQDVIAKGFGEKSLMTLSLADCEKYKDPKHLVKDFTDKFNEVKDKLTSAQSNIPEDVPDSVKTFQNYCIDLLTKSINVSLSSPMKERLKPQELQMYHIEPLKDLWNPKNEFTPAYIIKQQLHDGLNILETLPETICVDLEYWKLFNAGKTKVCMGKLVDEDVAKILDEITSFQDSNLSIDDGPTPDMLVQWVQIREEFFLSYVPYKAKFLELVTIAFDNKTEGGRNRYLNEANELVVYRRKRCDALTRTWLQLNAKLVRTKSDWVDALKSAKDSPKTMEAEAMIELLSLDAINKALQYGKEVGGDVANSSYISYSYRAMILAGGTVAVGSVSAAGEVVAGTGVAVGVVAAPVVAAAALAFVGASYVTYAQWVAEGTRRALALACLGYDFSDFGQDGKTWKSISGLVQEMSGGRISSSDAKSKMDARFRKHEDEFSWAVGGRQAAIGIIIKKFNALDHSKRKAIGRWYDVFARNHYLESSIIRSLIGKAKRVRGCAYKEHDLINEGGWMSGVVTVNCCNGLRVWRSTCKNCGKKFEPTRSSKFEQTPSSNDCNEKMHGIPCAHKLIKKGENESSAVVENESSAVVVHFYIKREYTPVPFTITDEILVECARWSSNIYDGDFHGEPYHFKGSNTLATLYVEKRTAHVTVRGTDNSNLKNWETNFDIVQTVVDDCEMHSGYLQISTQLIEIEKVLIERNVETVIFTGHSLGGAIAHCMHLRFLLHRYESQAMKTMSVGFGSPPLFGTGTNEFLIKNKLEDRFVTFINAKDPVPKLFEALKYFQSAPIPIDRAFLPVFNLFKKKSSDSEKYKDAYVFVGTNVLFNGSNHVVHKKHADIVKSSDLQILGCTVDAHNMEHYQKFLKEISGKQKCEGEKVEE